MVSLEAAYENTNFGTSAYKGDASSKVLPFTMLDTEDYKERAKNEEKKRSFWKNRFTLTNTKTFLIGAGTSAAVSMAIRSSVMGVGMFAGLGTVTVGGIAVVPVAAAALAGAGVGYYKYHKERRAQIRSGAEVTASLKKHLLAGTFLGFAGGAASQAVMEYILPNPLTQQVLGWAGQKLSAFAAAIPGADIAVDAVKSAGASVAAYAGAALTDVKSSVSSLFEKTKSGFTSLKGLFGFAKAEAPQNTPAIETKTPIQTVAQSTKADALVKTAPQAVIATPEIAGATPETPEINVPTVSVEDLKKNLEESFKAVEQLNQEAANPELHTKLTELAETRKFEILRNDFDHARTLTQSGRTEMEDKLSEMAKANLDRITGVKPAEVVGTTDVQTVTPPVEVAPVVSLADNVSDYMAGQKPNAASRRLITSAINGNAQAQKDLAVRLLNGTGGVGHNDGLAVQLLETAAGANNKQAIRDLAYLTMYGRNGVVANPEKAIEMIRGIADKDRMANKFLKLWSTENPAASMPKVDAGAVTPAETITAKPEAVQEVLTKEVPLPVARPDFEAAVTKTPEVTLPKNGPVPESRPVVTNDAAIKETPAQKPVVTKDVQRLPERGPIPESRPVPPEKITTKADAKPAFKDAAGTRRLAEPRPFIKDMNGKTTCSITAVSASGSPTAFTCVGGNAGQIAVGTKGSFPYRVVR